MHKRHPLNYFYFGILLTLMVFLHISHVLLVEEGTVLNRSFYIVYAIGQCLLEIGALVLIGALVAEKFPRFLNYVFIIGTFLMVLMHMIDFPLMRIMDMSVWYGLSFAFAESLDNFIEMLKASNIELMTWLLIGASAGALALMGVLLFYVTGRMSSRRPIHFSYRTATLSLLGIMTVLTFFDYQTSHVATPANDGQFLKALPWKTTFFSRAYPKWDLSSSLAPKPEEKWYQDQIGNLQISPKHRPNIYLFITESLREDFVTPENAPTLSQFRQENIAFPRAISGANATPYSWFSIFHSTYPFQWKERNPKKWANGSLPLQLFKKAGYQIHLYSASQLVFYQMDQVIFGRNHHLADDYQVFADQAGLASHAYDTQCIDTLIERMRSAEEGHLFIIFLEGTHFDYSWPEHISLPTRPAAAAIDYMRITYSKEDLEGIKNRYRHAIYHIDQQFQRFLTALKTHPRAEEAVVVFTSDHGEEFFEEGRLFHASNLNRVQTHVPLYYRLGKTKLSPSSKLTSHLDIFPTLLDYLSIDPQWFEGESILKPRQKPFAISARYHGSRTPFEFLMTTDTERLVARFDSHEDILSSKALEIVSLKDEEDQPLELKDEVRAKYLQIFNKAFSSISN